MQMDLAGRVAVVTGGESGIGAACAEALAAVGCDIAIIYHTDAAQAGGVRDKIVALGRRATIVACDVGNEAAVETAFDAIEKALGLPAILVNSAGINMRGVPVVDMDLDQWDRMIRTDLTGAFLTSRRIARGLRAAKQGGRIVNISSIHGTAVRAGGADYCAAKAGLENLPRTMAIVVAELGITVNAIAPGMILTPMNDRAQTDAAYRASLEHFIPAGRAGRAEEVGQMAVYLCSDAAAYVTDTVMTIDGGLSLEAALGA